jgi:serine/threonine protein kinase
MEPGERIGDYEVIDILGAGGMGKVYKVRNFISNRVEAMKVLLPDLTGNREVAERFLREIRVLASLDHPNIAELRTAQRADRQILMVMEYLDGQSLDRLLRAGRLTHLHIIDLLRPVLSALDYAHKRGIVHRDIKPSNVMITAAGEVKLMDFGIAKLSADRQLTSTGTTLGSVYYMSPEQIQGAEHVDARSDIYSIGVMLYEMATGQKPFDASSEFSLMSAHLNQDPRPPIQIDSSIPPMLNQVILTALAKDPAQRFQSAAAMGNALASVRSQLAPQEAAPSAAAPTPASTAPGAPSGPASGASVPPAPAKAVAPQPKSRRGLYIAAGSLATVAVLVAAMFVAPKFIRTSATGQMPAVQQPAPAAVPRQADQPPPAPDAEQPAQTAPQTVVQPKSEPPQQVPARTPLDARGSAQDIASPRRSPTSEAQAQRQYVPPQSPAQQPPVQASQPSPAQSTPPPVAGPSKAELNAAREEYNNLAIRAATVKSGLQNLQNQMGGLGLRADMREAASRLDYLMKEAMDAIRSGDLETARRNLDLADRTAERLEKFLGH